MYIHTHSIQYDTYNSSFLSCPPYSKILNIIIKNGNLIITFSSEQYVTTNYNNSYSNKTFYFKVLTGLHQNNTSIPPDYQYHSTLRVQENDMIEYYHIFIHEIKSADELRDSKINEVIN